MRFQDQGALVTGAGSGIGREVSLQLASEGAALALGDVDLAMAERTAEEIAKNGARHMRSWWT